MQDNNVTFGRSNRTQYRDKNGRYVCIGDWIEFLWWVPCSNNLQRKLYITGRILKRHGKIIFRYKDYFVKNGGPYRGPKMRERRLDALNFDSTSDFEIIDKMKHYSAYMPAYATRKVPQDNC